MRLTMFVVVLSSSVFAQSPGQVQAAQEQARHTVQAAQQSGEFNSGVDYRVALAPKFSPKPGTFHGVIPPVTITDDTKDAVIYFTTDGSTPTSKSQRYTGPISLSATATLKAIAIAPSVAQSRTARGKYVVK